MARNVTRNVFAVRATAEWYGWVRRLARHTGLTIPLLIERGLREVARKEGFDEPTPVRIPESERWKTPQDS